MCIYLERTMTESLDQILELIKKTGDRLVVIDRATQNNYVVMSIKDYERLALEKGKKREDAAEEFVPVDAKKEEIAQSSLPLGAVSIEDISETAKPDWWEEELEKPQTLEEKPVEDHYYLEPVES